MPCCWLSAKLDRGRRPGDRGGCDDVDVDDALAGSADAVTVDPGVPRSATIGVIGSSVVATTGSLPAGATPRRGHAKSSARPAGAGTASPLASTLVANASAAGC